MESVLLAVELMLDQQPLSMKKLCSAFQAQTGTSLAKACGAARPADVLAAYPNRFRIKDGLVRRARSELTESDYLAAAAGLAPSEAKALPEALAKCLQENLCFDCKVHFGGSVGRDTATVTMTDTDIVIAFENAQRKAAHEWAPPILAMLEPMLAMIPFVFAGEAAPILVLAASKGASYLTVQVRGQAMRVWVTPEVHRQHLKKIDWTSTAAPYLAPALDRPLTLWVRSQAPVVRHAMRLVKEWAAHQAWSSQYHTPPPAYLELIVIHCATEYPDDATSVSALVQRVHSILPCAEGLIISWKKAFAWYEPPAGLQAPTVLDPFHPVRNYADPAAFDASELARFAKAAQHLLGTGAALERPRSESGDSFISASSTVAESVTSGSTASGSAASTSDVSTAPSTPIRD